MRQLILYIIFLMSMVFSGYGEVSAASNSVKDSYCAGVSNKQKAEATTQQEKDDYAVNPWADKSKEDRLQKIDHKQDKPTAQLEDASVAAYRVCTSRPQRLLPSGNMLSHDDASRLLFNRIRFLSLLLISFIGGEGSRLESAPVHFDVASKYYVICLRHLRC